MMKALGAVLVGSTLTWSAAVLAQTAAQTPSGPQGQAGETSDRTPDEKTPTPQSQTDRVGGETSDRTPRHHGAAGPQGTRMSAADCHSIWSETGGGASLSQSQAQPHVPDFKSADADGDGVLSNDEFSKACMGGAVQGGAATGPGPGESGASRPSSSTMP